MPMLTFAFFDVRSGRAFLGQIYNATRTGGLNSVLIPDRQLTALPDAQFVEDPRVVSGGDRPVDPCNRLYLLAPETDAD